jgi:hypothetical protein
MLGRFRLSRRARPSRSPFSISGIDRILGFEFPAPPTKVCSSECVEKLSKKSGQPQNERLEAYETEQRGLISLRYDGDFCA